MPILDVRNAAGETDSYGLSREANHGAILAAFIFARLHGTEKDLPRTWFTPGGWEDWSDHGTIAKGDPNASAEIKVTYGDGERSFQLLDNEGCVVMSVDTSDCNRGGGRSLTLLDSAAEVVMVIDATEE